MLPFCLTSTSNLCVLHFRLGWIVIKRLTLDSNKRVKIFEEKIIQRMVSSQIAAAHMSLGTTTPLKHSFGQRVMLRVMFLNDLSRCKSSCSDLRCAATSECICREEFRTKFTCHAFQPLQFAASLPTTQGWVAIGWIFRFSTYPRTQEHIRSSNRFCPKSLLPPLFSSPAFRTAFFTRSTISSTPKQRAWTKEYSQYNQSISKESVLSTDVILMNFDMAESPQIFIEARLGRRGCWWTPMEKATHAWRWYGLVKEWVCRY